ncbi:lactonase family protein [Archangium violaceum]|uniref:lactonase family protein n=1 Tax=Archangium violaceum TaxID=83451 RepID=UPI00194F0AF6|nr:lactonase family protein [Archangium violaceum]QRO00222.1 lactonase family protein [Archangium violaceum]
MRETNWTRRELMRLTGLGAVGMGLACTRSAWTGAPQPPKELWVYVGTYTSGQGEGIYLCRLDLATGALQQVGLTRGVVEPSFLAMDPMGRYLYAVNELTEFEGKPGGFVSAFRIHPQTRELTFINQQPTQGGAPCHLDVAANGRFVLVANYVGGTVSVLPVLPEGGLGAAVDVRRHEGSGPNTRRQEGPHAHQVVLDADNRHALVSDLGLDKIMLYRFDGEQGRLTPAEPAWVSTQPGSGPRHLTFHPNGRFAFGIHELSSTITAFAYDPRLGALEALQTVSALPGGFTGTSYGADIHVSPDGRFLYGSNRGHDSIVVHAIDSSGRLTYVEHVPTRGRWPRHFTLEPTGRYLLVANQRTHDIFCFQRDLETGRLTPVGEALKIPAPVCLLVAPPPV